MNKRWLSIVILVVLLFLSTSASAQPEGNLKFRLEKLDVESPGRTECIQVGLFLKYSGTKGRAWSVANATLNYSTTRPVLAGTPVARISEFGEEQPGLTRPGTPQTNHMYDTLPCSARAIENSVSLGKGADIAFAEGSGRGTFSEFVNPQTGRIQLNAVSEKDLFFTKPGQEVLFAILTFPVAARAVGSIDLKFTPDSLVLDGNKLADNSKRGLTAITEDGSVTVHSRDLSLAGWGLVAFSLGLLLATFREFQKNTGEAREE